MRIRGCTTCLSLLLFALSIVLVQAGKGWHPTDLPSPQNDPRGICGRNGVKSAVCDPDGILSVSDKDAIDGFINFIAEGTNGFKVARCGDRFEGYQLAVLVIGRMNWGYHRFTKNAERAERFAKSIHDKWGVGDAECQNGVVLFISIDDKQMYISTGRGAKNTLTDSRVAGVLAQMRPLMKEEQYGRAVLAAVQRIGKVLSGTAPPEKEFTAGDLGFLALFGTIFFSCCCCAGIQTSRKRRKYSKCKAALRRIDNDTAAARNGTFKAQSCPICLEDFETDEDDKKEGSDKVPLMDEKEKKKKTRVALPCGHEFHEECITEWVEGAESRNRSTCPVCRKPVDGGEAPTQQRPSDYSAFEDERRFRIMRAHDLYPDYVTYSMARRYQRDSYINMQNHADFLRLDPVVVAEARSAGQGGSSFSFGGGSSSGGGGGGSSW